MDSTLWGIPYSDWRIYNSFAPWLSAIGTLVAVFLTLYIIWKDKFQLLKLELSLVSVYNIDVGFPGSGDAINLKIINKGFRPLKLVDVYIEYRRSHLFILDSSTHEFNKATVPFTLTNGEFADFYFIPELATGLKKTSGIFPLNFVVVSSLGKKFKEPVTKKLIEDIEFMEKIHVDQLKKSNS